jgi:hypothetical protein
MKGRDDGWADCYGSPLWIDMVEDQLRLDALSLKEHGVPDMSKVRSIRIVNTETGEEQTWVKKTDGVEEGKEIHLTLDNFFEVLDRLAPGTRPCVQTSNDLEHMSHMRLPLIGGGERIVFVGTRFVVRCGQIEVLGKDDAYDDGAEARERFRQKAWERP